MLQFQPLSLYRLFAVVCMAIGLAACASVAAPDVSQDAKALRKGTYALDQDNAYNLFNIAQKVYSTYVGRFERFHA